MTVLADPAHSRVVLLGTHSYVHLEQLSAVKNNIEELSRVFTSPRIWGVPDEHVHFNWQCEDATVLDAVEDAAKAATDTLLVYYSGHGLVSKKLGTLHLALGGSRKNADHTALSFDLLRNLILESSAQRKIVILDCCFSGRALIGGMTGESEISESAEIEGTYVLTSSAETKISLSPEGEPYTAFTGELLALLRNGIAGGPPLLAMEDIFKHCESKLRAKGRPLPQARQRNWGHKVAIARNTSPSARDLSAAEINDQMLVLARSLHARFEFTHDKAALDEAISLYEERILYTEIIEGEVRLLVDLGNALRARAEVANSLDDVDRAVWLLRDATGKAPSDNPYLSMLASSALANALRMRGQLTGDTHSIDEAIALLRETVARVAAADIQSSNSMLILGNTLAGSASRAQPSVFQEMVSYWTRVLNAPSATPRLRVQAGKRLAYAWLEEGLYTDAVSAFRKVIDILPVVISRRLHLNDKERELQEYLELASDAACAAILADDLENAVYLVENGRDFIANQAMQARADVRNLAAANPVLAKEFERIAQEFYGFGDPSGVTADQFLGEEAPADKLHSLAAAWDRIIGDVRNIPGFESFLQPTGPRDWHDCAVDGPIVIPNVSRFGCHALVVALDNLSCVSLPGVTQAIVREKALPFLDGSQLLHGGFDSRVAVAHGIEESLAWLNEAILEPVKSHLESASFRTNERLPERIWWSPTGLLNFVPLHAAGHMVKNGEGDQHGWEHTVSSYTSTLAALARSHRAFPASTSAALRKMLVVEVSYSDLYHPLPGAHEETSWMAGRLPDLRVLANAEATRESVMEALKTCTSVHFTCHSFANVEEPTRGGFGLFDGILTVGDISQLDLVGAELAFLPGCETSRNSILMPNESISLSGGLQLAGYRHVVGCLWPLLDEVSLLVTKAFYSSLARDDLFDPAMALHTAILEVSEKYRAFPAWWAGLVHFGPGPSPIHKV